MYLKISYPFKSYLSAAAKKVYDGKFSIPKLWGSNNA